MKSSINSLYRASNLGITHEAPLFGYNDPVIIENLAPASVASAEPVFSVPEAVPSLVVRTPSEVFGAQAPAPALPVTYVFDFQDATQTISIGIKSIDDYP